MRIVFFGCDDFAVVSFNRLIDDGYELCALVTRPDKPGGRGLRVVYSAAKELALRRAVDVFQPVDLKDQDVIRQLKEYNADVFVVVSYGKLLPEAVLNLPKYFCVNVHPSLLPKYRGAAPINRAVINGDIQTGVTLIRMNASMDGGDILAQEKHPLPEDITSISLREQLAALGAQMLSALLPHIPLGQFQVLKQDGALATRAPKLCKESGIIQWTESAKKIHDLVRGTQPWPGAYTFRKGNMLKILDAVPVGVAAFATAAAVTAAAGVPGEIVELHQDGFCVQAGDRVVLVKRVHPAGGKAMDARSYLAGHKLAVGEKLG